MGYQEWMSRHAHAVLGLTVVVLLIILLIGLGIIGLNIPNSKGLHPDAYLGTLLIVGVISLVLALALLVVVLNFLKLTDTKGALGLPPGTIRAIIALSLILIFMISSIFFFFQTSSASEIQSDVTQEQLNNMTGIVAIRQINETLFNVTTLAPGNAASTDIAKQVIGTMSTLVVAAAAFYFGTQAVTAAKEPEDPQNPLKRDLANGKITPEEFERRRDLITGKK